MKIPIHPPEAPLEPLLKSTDVVLDAIFGFSFKPPLRAPFDKALPLVAKCKKPVVSVDIPSGWDVDTGRGNTAVEGVLDPEVLVSLTAPKEGVKAFQGIHYLGGRFIPK
jgi:NAD(P)H-hydrate epimerase